MAALLGWAVPVPAVAPFAEFIAIAAGGYHSCAIVKGGGAVCWGRNGSGQLGDGGAADRSSPLQVTGLGAGATEITLGGYHSCAPTTTGNVYCWGSNTDGQLGDGTETDRWTPREVSGLGGGVNAISAGDTHTCTLTPSGGVLCWGGNNSGKLGDGTAVRRSSAGPVTGVTSGVVAVAAGGEHTCALTSGGKVQCWGNNHLGQLGDGTTTDRWTATDVAGLGSGVTAITAGGYHTCALRGGGVLCWGENDSGQVGDASVTNRSTARDVIGAQSGVTAIAAGAFHTCALMLGNVVCWGWNHYGQLGDGSTTDQSRARPVTGLEGVSVTAIAAGGYHTCALTADAQVKCWGYNKMGQLGDGTAADRPTPVSVLAPSAPAASTGSASDISSTGARLNGTVSSNGLSTAVSFQYGIPPTYGLGAAPATQNPIGAAATNVMASATVSGLSCNTSYHFRAVATNGAGTAYGADASFTTGACPVAQPTVITTSVSGITSTGATFNGTVTSNGASTTVTFQYGLTTSYGGSVTAAQSPLTSGASGAAVSAVIAGLSCNTTYHVRTVATNSAGTTVGPDVTFVSAPCVAPTAMLTVVPAGSGAGTVISSPPGIACGADCKKSFADGTGVTLLVTPFAGSAFGTWGGACTGTGGCTVNMTAATSVTATFVYIGSTYSRDYAQKAYMAYYGRPAEPAGQAYWAGRMDSEGQSLAAIIGAFGNSEEFDRRYGGMDYAALVTKVYRQTLGRDPDSAGLAFYVGELQAGRRTLQTITLDVLNGATAAPDSTVVANKLEVAAYYTAKVIAGCAYGTEEHAAGTVSGVTASFATVTAAKAAIDARCAA